MFKVAKRPVHDVHALNVNDCQDARDGVGNW